MWSRGADAAGEEEGAAESDGTEGVEFVGVVDDLGFESGRCNLVAVAVTAHGGSDGGDERGRKIQFGEPLGGEFRAEFGVADRALGGGLFGAGDVVEQRGGLDDFEIGFGEFPGEHPGVGEHAQRVVEVVAAGAGAEFLTRPLFEQTEFFRETGHRGVSGRV